MPNQNGSNQRLRTLKTKHKIFKSQIATLTKQLEEYQDSPKERIKVRERVERLRKQFEIFNEIQNELGQHENFDQTETERASVSDLYDDVIATAVTLLESFNTNNTHLPTATITNDSATLTKSPNIVGVHLPKINLPQFDGRLEKWISFKDAFLSLIHSHTGLTDVQRLNYLKLSLSGKAESVIESFTISAENYKAAWNQLEETYDNRRALILRHSSLLIDSPAMTNDSPESIRDLINHMQSHIRSLQALGRSWEEIANDLLTSIAIDRMGPDTRKGWEQSLTDTRMPSVTDIFKHLRNASHQSKSISTTAITKQRVHISPEPLRQLPVHQSRALKRNREFVTTSKGKSSSPYTKTRIFATTFSTQGCRICKSAEHKSYACPKFTNMPVNERWIVTRTAKLCPNCLEPDHTIEACQAGRCRVCKGKHNTKLHQNTKPPNNKTEA